MSNYIKDSKTMNDLYQGALEKRIEHSVKKGETLSESEENAEESGFSLGILLFPLLVIDFIIRLFITEPKRHWGQKTHLFMGLAKSFTYAYLMYNITSVAEYVESIGVTGSYKTFLMAGIVIFSMIQFFYGIYVVGGWNNFGMDIAPGDTKKYISVKRSPSAVGFPAGHSHTQYNNSNEEIDQTFRYMNAKMGGMSNSKKEKYLRDFYGGGSK